jgi:type III pantothenate kinase
MTDLLVDFGNTRLKWAQSAPGCWLPGAIVHRGRDMAELLDTAWAPLERPARVVLVSVAAPEDTGLLELWIGERWRLGVHRARSSAQQLGVVNRYRDPESLGADRWVGLLGARGLTERACVVIDCGTAVTIDALAADGVFAGGVIIPGLQLWRASLSNGTAGIAPIVGSDASCLARTTADGVAAGALFGLAGAIDRIVNEQERVLEAELEVLITGGDAPLLMPRLSRTAVEIPDLVLKGLARVAEEPA